MNKVNSILSKTLENCHYHHTNLLMPVPSFLSPLREQFITAYMLCVYKE